MPVNRALVCGAGGFIGSHLVKRLKYEGYWVRGVDLKYPEFGATAADDFVVADLREAPSWEKVLGGPFDEAYQLAADMGGAGFVFTGENDSEIMHNSAMINLHMADYGVKRGVKKIFYSSSACMYPAYNQEDPENDEHRAEPMCLRDRFVQKVVAGKDVKDVSQRSRGKHEAQVGPRNSGEKAGEKNDQQNDSSPDEGALQRVCQHHERESVAE